MKDLGTATVATIAMTMFGVPTVLILAGVDRGWLTVVAILAVSPFLIVFYNRLQELQAEGKSRIMSAQVHNIRSGHVIDVTPRAQQPRQLPPPWTVTEESVTDDDLRAFVRKMFATGTWSRRSATRWLLPDAGWVSEGIWRVIMDILEDRGVLSQAQAGQSRRLLVDTEAQALARLGLQPVERWSGGAEVDVSKNFTIRIFD